MTPEKAMKAIRALRDAGCAVTVFTPDELDGADPTAVEDMMVQRGWDAIDTLKVMGFHDEN